jgi:CubicO group peptidase (beta-lactamase class C family)
VPDANTIEKPESLGVVPERLDALLTRIRREVEEGLLPSCQLALARDGRLAAFETVGAAKPTTRYVVFSATKAIVASAAWILIGEGKLDLGSQVSALIPEFASNGKDVVTVEQVMLHTSGFPLAPLGPRDWGSREKRLQAFARWRLNWEPGTRFEYHASSAHWVLAELIERAAGEDYRSFIRSRIAAPLGLELGLGIPEDQQQDIAAPQSVGDPPGSDELAAIGLGGLDLGEVTEDALLRMGDPANIAVGVPGGGGVMTAADMALFYQALLHNPGGIWDPDTLADATGNVRCTFPDALMLGASCNRTIGVMVAGDDGKSFMRSMGRTVSPRAFGHPGAGGQIAWADPESGISLCYLTDGMDRNPLREGKRGVAISSLAGAATQPL